MFPIFLLQDYMYTNIYANFKAQSAFSVLSWNFRKSSKLTNCNGLPVIKLSHETLQLKKFPRRSTSPNFATIFQLFIRDFLELLACNRLSSELRLSTRLN